MKGLRWLIRRYLGIEDQEVKLAQLRMAEEKWRRLIEKETEQRIWAHLKEVETEMGEGEKAAWESGTDYDGSYN